MSIKSFFDNVGGFMKKLFTPAHLTELGQLVELASPIVADIAAMTPNRTVQEINKAYQVYGLPADEALLADHSANGVGNAMLNLGTAVLQKNHAPTASVSLLNTAIQIAVLAQKQKAA